MLVSGPGINPSWTGFMGRIQYRQIYLKAKERMNNPWRNIPEFLKKGSFRNDLENEALS